ncbi:MAG: M42 family metallopeptidase [Trueperaceae bacterium]
MSKSISDEALTDFQTLATLPGLAGHEQRVASFMSEKMRPHADNVYTDTLGNVIATVNGSDADAPSIMVSAHMDSLGFIVRKIEDDGFIRVYRLGGIPEKVLPATKITITNSRGKDIPGIIGIKAHHVTPPEEKYKVTPLQELFIDIGARSKAEVQQAGIQTGDPITYTGQFQRLANDTVTATFIDNRGGCLAVLETLRRLAKNRPKATTHIVATVQEEFNLRGAAPVAHALRPAIALCVDGTVPGDTPDLAGSNDVRMGGGPAMNLYSFHGRGTLNGLVPHPALVRAISRSAEEDGLVLQRSAFFGGLTEGSYVQLENGGTPTIDLSFSMRYSHSPAEMCHLGDVQGLIDLLSEFIPKVSADFDFSR